MEKAASGDPLHPAATPKHFRPKSRKLFPYNFSKNSHPEHEIKIPPGTPRSRSFTRFTMRVGLPHLGQSVLLDVSITFFRSAVLAILAILYLLAKFLPQAAGLTKSQS
jgi:hypothetical protein